MWRDEHELDLPYVPIAPGVRVGIAIVSYNGRLAFGITGDFDTAPDIDVVAHGVEEAIAELVEIADLADHRRSSRHDGRRSPHRRLTSR